MFVLAKEDGKYVYAYNDKFLQVLNEPGELYQYTDKTVAIRRGKDIYIYNDQGSLIATHPKDFVDISNIAGVLF